MKRATARGLAVVGALTFSCGAAQAGMLDTLLGGGIPIPVPGIGGFRVSQGQRMPMQQTPRMVAGRLYNEAIDLSHANRMQESRTRFEQAVQVDPSFEMAWGALVGSCMNTGALEEGLQVGNYYLQHFPNGSRRKETSLIMQKLREQISTRNDAYSRVGADGADSYYALATEGGKNFYGWNLSSMPLKVYIPDGKGVRGYNPNDSVLLNNSFVEWTKATDGHISFTRVDNAEEANIECIWIDDQRDFPHHSGMEAGMAAPLLDSNGLIVHSKLYLLTRSRHDGKAVDEFIMHGVCLHEIGHTLGLLGHSDNPGDVMYFSANNQKVEEPHLTQRDVNTLAKLYAKILTDRSTASNPNPSTQDAPEVTLASSSSQGLAPDSVALLPAEPGKQQPYSNGMSFESNMQAIEYFEKAVAHAPNDMNLLDDLGTAYANYGIELANSNDVRKAEKYFNLAYAIHRNSPDRTKLRTTVANFMQLLRFEKRDSEAAKFQAKLDQ